MSALVGIKRVLAASATMVAAVVVVILSLVVISHSNHFPKPISMIFQFGTRAPNIFQRTVYNNFRLFVMVVMVAAVVVVVAFHLRSSFHFPPKSNAKLEQCHANYITFCKKMCMLFTHTQQCTRTSKKMPS